MSGSVDLEHVIKNLEEGGGQGTDARYTGLFIRSLAQLFDTIFTFYLMFLVFAALRALLGGASDALVEKANFIGLAIWLPYFFGAWLLFQATPGKMVFNCRIVDADTGGCPSLWQFFVRFVVFNLILGLSAIGGSFLFFAYTLGGSLGVWSLLSFLPMLGFLMIPFSETKQGIHDKLANTVVVRY